MKKIFILLLLIPTAIISQNNDEVLNKGFSWDKLTVGGGLGLAFGTVTVIDVSPTVGYYFSDQFIGGIGISYLYYKDESFLPAFQTDVYGAKVFGQYFLDFAPIIIHTEIENQNVEAWDTGNRVNVINLLAGGGIRQMIGDHSFIQILVLWNFNETIYTIYPNPIIRGGFAIGI
jgi:hypothetical protein